MNLFRPLRQRHLRTLWGSQVLSSMGDHLYDLAVIWTAVQVAGSGAGLVAATNTAARLVFGLLGGVYADRWNRRAAMIGADLVRAVAVVTLPVLAQGGHLTLWHLAAVSAVLGALGSLFDPALQASLPVLAPDVPTLRAMNGLMDGTRRLALALAPSFAGVIIVVLPLAQFFTLDAISFAVSALAVASLGTRFAWQPVRVLGERHVLREVAGAVRLVREHALVWWYLCSNVVSNIAWGASFRIGIPLLAARALGGNVGALGLLMGAYGVGNILSNFVVGSITVRRPTAMLFASNIVLGAGFALVAIAPNLPFALLGTALGAIGGPMGDILLTTMLQHDFPPDQIGKVFSLRFTLGNVGLGLGLLAASPLFALVSPRIGIGLCALVIAATGATGIARFRAFAPQVAPDRVSEYSERV